jgi:hypothetical protein
VELNSIDNFMGIFSLILFSLSLSVFVVTMLFLKLFQGLISLFLI